ncbi:DUF790 family protein [uncultured Victivallis sp.]|uniref:DUF790 family protein n=1 Tax=uncultured Victivallis sp. TaxID=354118 RepID=UPI0025FFF20C|nr:DUF790 family protein [uncultured Victivallis sp.]
MLTRELLRFRKRNGFLPAFIDPADPKLLEFAAGLLALYTEAAGGGMRRAELEELVNVQLQGVRDRKLAEGLNKLVLDRCSFDPVRLLDYPAERRRLFLAAAEALKRAGGRLEAYREALFEAEGAAEFMAADLYGDLPDNERLTGWRPLYPGELLNRYNLALVQGLLIYSEELELTVADPDPAELRRLFKYLRFFRLLAEVSRGKGRRRRTSEPDLISLRISGPFAIFANTRKYALQLAAFFPAVVNVKEWTLAAKIRLGENRGELKLDQKCGLVSHYRNFSSYVPEEIRMFHRLFRERSVEWRIVGESPFLDGGGQEIVFPDLSFRRESDGTTLHLELFHRWHRGQLDRRLELLEREPEIPLLIGVDRALADDEAWAVLTEQRHPSLAVRMFRFRDFPGVERVTHLLNAFAAESFPGEKRHR